MPGVEATEAGLEEPEVNQTGIGKVGIEAIGDQDD